LPDRIKALVQQCILNFTNSVSTFVKQVQNIPGQVTGTINSTINNYTQGLNSSVKTLTKSLSSATTANPSISSIVSGSASTQDKQSLQDFIKSSHPAQDKAAAASKQSTYSAP